VARGDCVNEGDLIVALQQGIIAGAGLDVTADEKIAADNPLLNMPNVILTGHSAQYSEPSYADLWMRPATQIAMAMRGEFPRYAVNSQVKKLWQQKWGKKDTIVNLRAIAS
jgi:D-3-phosphoglycerate dehydrogenase